MSKINVNELSINELQEIVSGFFPKMSLEDINNISVSTLQMMITDEISDAVLTEPLEEFQDTFESYSFSKHLPSRKKKAKRIKKNSKIIKYQKSKNKLIAKQTRKRVDEETTNRAYLEKASKAYIPNRKLYSL